MSEITPARLRRGFVPIYRKLSRCGPFLSLHAKAVMWNLMERLGQNSSVWPSQVEIGDDLGLSERSVWAALKDLESVGFIVSERRGLGRSNAYRIDLERLLDWAEHKDERTAKNASLEPQPVRPDSRNMCESLHNEETEKEEHIKKRPNNSRSKIDWSRYPESNNDEREPAAIVERWLVKWARDRFTEKIVAKHLQHSERFFVWRKIKQLVDDGDHGTLKALMPRAQAEYQTEIDQIQSAPDSSSDPEHDRQMLEVYRQIKDKQEADAKAEYEAWERENYPAVANA